MNQGDANYRAAVPHFSYAEKTIHLRKNNYMRRYSNTEQSSDWATEQLSNRAEEQQNNKTE